MPSKLFYCLIILIFTGCKSHVVPPDKVRKIAVHTFTGKGEHDETVNWFYIKKAQDKGFGGFYLESAAKVNDFRQTNFIYSKERPLKFEGQYASEETIQLVEPRDLPDDILKDSFNLESVYQR